ncbi:MAG: hypothetical protein L6R41_004394 [Letrouitia leprolyta]|nr:MAG: hypothetical protein L6R41_004394 [Letrouitia leprolyta]
MSPVRRARSTPPLPSPVGDFSSPCLGFRRSRLQAKIDRALAPLQERNAQLEEQCNRLKQHWVVDLEFGTAEEKEDGIHEWVCMRGREWGDSDEGMEYVQKEESWRRKAVAEALGVVREELREEVEEEVVEELRDEVREEMEGKYARKVARKERANGGMAHHLQLGIAQLEQAAKAITNLERKTQVAERSFDIVLGDYEGEKAKVRRMQGEIDALRARAEEAEAKVAALEREKEDLTAQLEAEKEKHKPVQRVLRKRPVRGG